jgi:mono/diheme cytochrome c family protein
MKKIAFVIVAGIIAIASCSKKTTPAKAPAIDGAAVFSNNCARCHGPEGIKNERMPNLQTIPLDKAGLVNVITHGKDRMPAFQDKLSAAEISAVADLILSWHKK